MTRRITIEYELLLGTNPWYTRGMRRIPGVRVVRNQVAVLAQDVRSNNDHGLMCRGVQQSLRGLDDTRYAYLVTNLDRVVLHILPVRNDLDDALPHFVRNIVPGNPDELENDVDIPIVVPNIALRQDGNLQHLRALDILSLTPTEG